MSELSEFFELKTGDTVVEGVAVVVDGDGAR